MSPEADLNRLDPLSTPFARTIEIARDAIPALIVVVDTEEEFPWNKPHSRSETSVTAMRQIVLGQRLFDEHGIKPIYVVDYPVAANRAGYSALAEIHKAGRAIVGAHLHPWVNPPFDESVNTRNSFPGNLDAHLEEAKLRVLSDQIETSFGERPTFYKAGRYGFGANTAEILERLGYRVDLSPAPGYDYSAEAGPDYSNHPNHPRRLGRTERVICLPCTGAIIGKLAPLGSRAMNLVQSPLSARLKLGAVFARLRLLERIRLSPEGFSLHDMVRLTRRLLEIGVRIFTLSYHSPSLVPGFTPYVRTQEDLDAFLARTRDYLEFFGREIGGVFPSPDELVSKLERT